MFILDNVRVPLSELVIVLPLLMMFDIVSVLALVMVRS